MTDVEGAAGPRTGAGNLLCAEDALEAAARACRSHREIAEWEVYLEQEQELEIEVKDGRVESLTSARTQGLAIRVLSRERPGFSFTNKLMASSIRETADRALANSKLMPPRPGFSFPCPSPNRERPGLAIFDEKILEVPREDKIKKALAMEQNALDHDPRIARVYCSEYEESLNRVFLRNSNGLDVHGRSTLFSISLEAVAEEKGEAQAALEFETEHHYDKLDECRISAEAAQRAVMMLGARPIPAGSMPVILSPRAAAGLIAILAPAACADAVKKGRSWLGPKLGEPVASPLITVVDDGLFAAGPAAFAFDDEGTGSQRTVVIREGILTGFLYDAYYGKSMGHPSTGNGIRPSYLTLPVVDSTNWVLVSGDRSEEDLLKEMDQGLYVSEFLGLHTADPVAGEFSLGAVGRLVNQGRLDRPVTGVALAGTVEELLMRVRAVANNLSFTSDLAAPSVLIEEMDISGAEEKRGDHAS